MKWNRFLGFRSLSLSSSLLRCKTHQSMLFNVQRLLYFCDKTLSPTLRILVHGQIWIPKQIFPYCLSFRLRKKKDQYSLPETNCILLADNHYHLCCTALSTRSSAQGISFENLLFTILPIILHFVTFNTRRTRWSRSLAILSLLSTIRVPSSAKKPNKRVQWFPATEWDIDIRNYAFHYPVLIYNEFKAASVFT